MPHPMLQKTIKLLNTHYFASIFLLAALFVSVIFRIVPFFTEAHPLSVVAERYAVMAVIIAIPLSLKLFALRIKKPAFPLAIPAAAKKYKNASFLRLYVLVAITLANIFLFAFTRNMNFFWFTVVLFLVFLFCKPSYGELENLTPQDADADSQPTIPGEHPEKRLHDGLAAADSQPINLSRDGHTAGE